ncbi:hypothetical protein V2J09_022624 [Rumex salicifolius]
MERSLMDEVLGFNDQSNPSSLLGDCTVLIEDCVQTSGAFVIHHIIKRTLTSPNSSGLVVFVALAHPFSHYDRILRKLGCNLAVHRDSKRFVFFDMLLLKCSELNGDGGQFCKGGLIELYGKIQKALEVLSSDQDSQKHITIIIDDFSLIEVAANGSSTHCKDFLHYFQTLTSEFNCSLVILNHQDIYDGLEKSTSLLQMEYNGDFVLKVEPLATGMAEDVHGQVTVVKKGTNNRERSLKSNVNSFHFRLKENGVECFYPGTKM